MRGNKGLGGGGSFQEEKRKTYPTDKLKSVRNIGFGSFVREAQ